jgi:hypothetical protein
MSGFLFVFRVLVEILWRRGDRVVVLGLNRLGWDGMG